MFAFSILKPSASAWCPSTQALALPCSDADAGVVIAYDLLYKLLAAFTTFVLFCVVASLGIGKIYVDGIDSYSSFFTNWAWSMYGVYYFLVLIGHLCCEALLRMTLLLLTLAVNGICWSVLAIVFVILYNNPDLLLGMMSGLGGTAPAGLVVVMNCMFHPVAVVLFLVFLVVHKDDVKSVFFDARYSIAGVDFWWTVMCCLLLVYSPVYVLGVYMMFNNPTYVYGYQVFTGYTFAAVVFICTAFNGIPLLLAVNRMPARPVQCDMCCGFHTTTDLLHGISILFAYTNAIRRRFPDDREGKANGMHGADIVPVVRADIERGSCFVNDAPYAHGLARARKKQQQQQHHAD